MRELDKKFYKALIFFDKNTTDELDKIKKDQSELYGRNVSQDIENDLYNLGYVDPGSKRKYIITPKGQEELRKLDEIKSREDQLKVNKWAIIISGIALFIAIFSLAKSMELI